MNRRAFLFASVGVALAPALPISSLRTVTVPQGVKVAPQMFFQHSITTHSWAPVSREQVMLDIKIMAATLAHDIELGRYDVEVRLAG